MDGPGLATWVGYHGSDRMTTQQLSLLQRHLPARPGRCRRPHPRDAAADRRRLRRCGVRRRGAGIIGLGDTWGGGTCRSPDAVFPDAAADRLRAGPRHLPRHLADRPPVRLAGLAVVLLVVAVIGPPRDYAYMRRFPEWVATRRDRPGPRDLRDLRPHGARRARCDAPGRRAAGVDRLRSARGRRLRSVFVGWVSRACEAQPTIFRWVVPTSSADPPYRK